jgi:hypothetical protein
LKGFSQPELDLLHQFIQSELKVQEYVLEQFAQPFLEPLRYRLTGEESFDPKVDFTSLRVRSPSEKEQNRRRFDGQLVDCGGF